MASSTAGSEAEMRKLLRQEEEECARLERQIKILSAGEKLPADVEADDGASGSRSSYGSRSRSPSDGSVRSGDSRSSGARSRSRSGSRSGSSVSSRSRSGSRSRSRSPSGSRSRSRSSSRSSRSSSVGSSSSIGSGSRSRRRGRRGRSATKAQRTPRKAGRKKTVVQYRSPLYRAPVDAKKGSATLVKYKDGQRARVVVSNFSRAPRFRDEKTWVPGPGMYATHDSTFHPTLVERTEGRNRRGGRRRRHKGAAADPPPPPPGTKSSGKKPSGKLAAALQRERELRKQLTAAQSTIAQHRLEVTTLQREAKSRVEELSQRVSTTQERLRSASTAVRALRDSFSLVKRLNASLQRCVRDNYPIFASTAASARFLDLQSKSQSLDDAVVAMDDVVQRAGTGNMPAAVPPPPPISTGHARGMTRGGTRSGLSAVLEADAAAAEAVGEQLPLGRSRSASISRNADASAPGVDGSGGDGGAGSGGGASSPGRAAATTDVVPTPSPSGKRGAAGIGGGAQRPNDMLSAADVKSFVRAAHRQTVGLLNREAQEAAQAAAVRRLHEQFGVGLDAKLSRSPNASGYSPGFTPRSSSSPRNTLTPSRRRKTRLTRGGSPAAHSPLVPTKLAPTETTMAEKLRHIFKYYCSFGDRMNETFLTNPKLLKLVKDARIVGPTFRPADVDIVFNQVVRQKTGGAGGKTNRVSVMPGSRIDFDQFVSAMGRIAERKYKKMETAAALRQLMTKCVLPLYQRLKKKPTFMEDVLQVGRQEELQKFSKEFLQPTVIEFFNENRIPLQALFTRYAMQQTVSEASAPATSWKDVREAYTTLSLRAFLKFCQDFKLMPGELSRPDFITLFKYANQGAVGPSGVPEPLTYLNFVELMCLLALNLIHDDVQCPTALTKVQMLFFSMHERGGKFEGEEAKLVRNVTKTVKAHLLALRRSAEMQSNNRKQQQASALRDVLQEEVLI